MSIASIGGAFSAQKDKAKQTSKSELALMPQTNLDKWLSDVYRTESMGGPGQFQKYNQIASQKRAQENDVSIAEKKLAAAKARGDKYHTNYWSKALQNRQDKLAITSDKLDIYKPAYKAEAEERQTGVDEARDAITQYLTENAGLVPGAMREQAGIQSGTLDELIRQGTSREGYLPDFSNLLKNLTSGGTDISFGGQPVISNYMSQGKANALQSLLAANQQMPGVLSGLAQERSNINVAPEQAQYEYGFMPLEQKLNFAQSPDATMVGGMLSKLMGQMELPNILRYLQGGIESESRGEQDSVGWSGSAQVGMGGGSSPTTSGASKLPTYNRKPLQIPQMADNRYNSNFYR